jgi:hypothetical protein
MTAAALRLGAVNGVIWSSILIVNLLLVAEMITFVSHFSFGESLWLALALIWGPTFVLFVGAWLNGLNAGGRVLLDCGPHPARWVFLIQGALYLVVGVGGTVVASSFSNSLAIVAPVFGISYGILLLIVASGRFQIREGGLWRYCDLLRWDKIESCQWSADSTLMLQANTPFPFLGRGALPVAPEDKQAINELMQKHCSSWDRDF